MANGSEPPAKKAKTEVRDHLPLQNVLGCPGSWPYNRQPCTFAEHAEAPHKQWLPYY